MVVAAGVAEEAKVEDKVVVAEEAEEASKVRHKVVGDRTLARLKPTPGIKGPGTLMGPQSRPVNSTGFMGNLRFTA